MRLFNRWMGLLGAVLCGWGVGGCAGAGTSGRMITIHAERRPPREVAALIDGWKGCYRAALRRRPGQDGELTLSAEFKSGGGLRSFTLDSELPAEFQTCIRNRVARWRLSPSSEIHKVGPLKVTFRPVREMKITPRARPALGDTLVWPEDMPKATRAGDATVGGRIRRVLRDRVANLRYCFNRELIRQPGYRAAARVSFTINPYGQPYLVRVKPARPGSLNQPMVSCLKQKVVEWHFFRVPVDIR